MIARIGDRVKFALERFVLGGPLNRLFLIAILIGLLAIAGGAIVLAFGQRTSGLDSFGEALWWAFLRLSDPGYLGDDTGTVVRIVSTTLTVLGYVVFLGSLVAIMTQWLNSTLAQLQGGYTTLALNNHLLILGWSARAAAIVREILLSEGRVKRFLTHRGAGRLRVVILADEVVPSMLVELRDRLGDLWSPDHIILRTGSPLRVEHLRRADFLHAAAILLPSPELPDSSVEYPDARTIKAILATGKSSRESGAGEMPLLVAEISDARKLSIAQSAYRGPIEVIASDLIRARLLAQTVRHPGLSFVYAEMLRHDVGSEIYLREFPELHNRPAGELPALFPNAIPLGILGFDPGGTRAHLNPPAERLVRPGERIVLLAPSFEDAAPEPRTPPGQHAGIPPFAAPPQLPLRRHRRILVLGWNRAVPAIIREFEGYEAETFELDILSLVPQSERTAELERFDAAPRRTKVRLLEGEYTSLSHIQALGPASYDNVVILSTDRLESPAERDARTILGSLVLEQAMGSAANRPDVLLEILDAENVPLARDCADESLLSPAVMSHILAQVALNRDLRVVYDELFGPEGAEIFFRPASHYGICGKSNSFADIQSAATSRREVALGLRLERGHKAGNGGVVLNPGRGITWELQDGDDIVVLTNY